MTILLEPICCYSFLSRRHRPAKILPQHGIVKKPAHRHGEQESIDPIEHPTVSGKQRTGILQPSTALQHRFYEVTQLRGYVHGKGESDHSQHRDRAGRVSNQNSIELWYLESSKCGAARDRWDRGNGRATARRLPPRRLRRLSLPRFYPDLCAAPACVCRWRDPCNTRRYRQSIPATA